MNKKQLIKFREEIEKRGGEILIEESNYGKRGDNVYVDVMEKGKSEGKVVYLLGCNAWRYYSRRAKPRKASLRYIVGSDDSGLWAVRVPGTIDTVKEAVEWIVPAEIQKAKKQRQKVLRQGNLYFIQVSKRSIHFEENQKVGDHEYFSRARVVLHPEHKPLVLPKGYWKPVQQKSLFTSRGGSLD